MTGKRLYAIFIFAVFMYMSASYELEKLNFLNNKYTFVASLVEIIVITIVMCFIPCVIYLVNKGKIDYKKGNVICVLNSLLLFVIPIILGQALVGGIAAVFYYYINMWLFVKDKNGLEDNSKKSIVNKLNAVKKTKDDTKVNVSKTRYCKICGGKLDERKKCKKCGKQYFYIYNKLIVFALLFIITVLIFLTIYFAIKSINKSNKNLTKNNVKKSTTTKIIKLQSHTDNEWCPYVLDMNIKAVEVEGESSSGVGDIFSKKNYDLEYRLVDNKIGDYIKINYKFTLSDENADNDKYYNCDDWYYINNGEYEGYLWGGKEHQYVTEYYR